MSTMPPNSLSQSAQSSNPWFVVSVGLICFMVGFGASSMNLFGEGSTQGGFIAGNNNVPVPPVPPTPPGAPDPAPNAENVPPVNPKTDHIRGNADAEISVIEYSDFECPFCKRHHPTMIQLTEKYGDNVNWVYRHFPLSFHQNAEPAAIGSECASELGGNDAFWKFTDGVFESDGFDFAAIAKKIGLNEAKFKACMESGKHKQFIQDQMAGGTTAGVNGTPGGIILNHKTGEAKLVSGAQPLSAFTAIIDPMLGK